MKRLLLAATAVAALIPHTASYAADDITLAVGVLTMVAYDEQCEKIPLALTRAAEQALNTITESTYYEASGKVLAAYKTAGRTTFCRVNKPIIDKASANFR